MYQAEFIRALAHRTGVTEAEAATLLAATTQLIMEQVMAGHKVHFTGLGTFEPRRRSARHGRDVETGAALVIPATVEPVFVAGMGFRQQVEANLLEPDGCPANEYPAWWMRKGAEEHSR